MTQVLSPDEIATAAALLRDGACVAFPTETVYGLGADATDDAAVAGIFAAKDRPRFNPLIVHVPDAKSAWRLVDPTPEARKLAQAHWPGPLSLVLPLKADTGLSDLVTAGLGTLAVRVPAHPLAVALLRLVGRPVAAPSANPSGKISPTTAAHVTEALAGRIAAVLDGGACDVGLESSIFGGNPMALLRPGGVTLDDAEVALGRPVTTAAHSGTQPLAPGQLASHYAPEAAIKLDVTRRESVPHLGFGPGPADINLSERANLTEAATCLFAALRDMDALAAQAGASYFTVSPIPSEGLGLAIRDRLTRAAAPRL